VYCTRAGNVCVYDERVCTTSCVSKVTVTDITNYEIVLETSTEEPRTRSRGSRALHFGIYRHTTTQRRGGVQGVFAPKARGRWEKKRGWKRTRAATMRGKGTSKEERRDKDQGGEGKKPKGGGRGVASVCKLICECITVQSANLLLSPNTSKRQQTPHPTSNASSPTCSPLSTRITIRLFTTYFFFYI
jgi:hypothetical protein